MQGVKELKESQYNPIVHVGTDGKYVRGLNNEQKLTKMDSLKLLNYIFKIYEEYNGGKSYTSTDSLYESIVNGGTVTKLTYIVYLDVLTGKNYYDCIREEYNVVKVTSMYTKLLSINPLDKQETEEVVYNTDMNYAYDTGNLSNKLKIAVNNVGQQDVDKNIIKFHVYISHNIRYIQEKNFKKVEDKVDNNLTISYVVLDSYKTPLLDIYSIKGDKLEEAVITLLMVEGGLLRERINLIKRNLRIKEIYYTFNDVTFCIDIKDINCEYKYAKGYSGLRKTRGIKLENGITIDILGERKDTDDLGNYGVYEESEWYKGDTLNQEYFLKMSFIKYIEYTNEEELKKELYKKLDKVLDDLISKKLNGIRNILRYKDIDEKDFYERYITKLSIDDLDSDKSTKTSIGLAKTRYKNSIEIR